MFSIKWLLVKNMAVACACESLSLVGWTYTLFIFTTMHALPLHIYYLLLTKFYAYESISMSAHLIFKT